MDNYFGRGWGRVPRHILEILLYIINKIKFSGGMRSGPSLSLYCMCEVISIEFSGGDPLSTSRSIHQQGVSHNEIRMLLCLIYGKQTAGK